MSESEQSTMIEGIPAVRPRGHNVVSDADEESIEIGETRGSYRPAIVALDDTSISCAVGR